MPWKKVATDLFEKKGQKYLLLVDYYSQYIEVAKFTGTTSVTVINHLKSIFSHHRIPQTLISDNGSQYSAKDFVNFAAEYGYTHFTSSPLYSQANSEIERVVSIVKNLLKKSKDPHLATVCCPTGLHL